MSEIKIFELTQKILQESENQILNNKSQTKLVHWLSEYTTIPIKLLFKGYEELSTPIVRWLFMIIVILFFVTSVFKTENLPFEILPIIFIICSLIATAMVAFSIPSTYVYYGIKPKDIDSMVDYLESLEIQEISTIECIQNNLENIKIRISNRISTYKWFIGASWGFAILISKPKIISLENIPTMANIILISALALSLVASYKRASEILIKTLEFSLTEIKYKSQKAIRT